MLASLLFVVSAFAIPPVHTVRDAFPPPPGAVRVDGGSFGTWLGARPLRDPAVPVKTYDGRVVGHEGRVVEMPLVEGDLQQCADSLMRLRAEYQLSLGEKPVFHATSGDPMPWTRYQNGEAPREVNNRLQWSAGGDRSWDGWLKKLFMWAGTRSLVAYDTVPLTGDPRPGDMLVQAGSPGHAVVFLDVAKKGNETYLLVAEGFMPAQDFHVETGPQSGWWKWEDGLDLPHWSFETGDLRRWKGTD